jgi:hypothetical protein
LGENLIERGMNRHISTLSLALLPFFPMDSSAKLPDGSIVPDFTTTDINGVHCNLYELLDSGNIIILEFLAAWCGSCWSYKELRGLDGYCDFSCFYMHS